MNGIIFTLKIQNIMPFNLIQSCSPISHISLTPEKCYSTDGED
jgi:hypothetical protein